VSQLRPHEGVHEDASLNYDTVQVEVLGHTHAVLAEGDAEV
jgi:hypothetical protein